MRISLIVSFVLLGLGCGAGERRPAVDAPDLAATLTQAAALVTDRFQQDLRGELMAAMNTGGAAAAIEVCRTRAPEIAAQHSRVGAWSIARVSDRPRRPEQAADDRQRAALAKFSDTALADQALTEWLADERGDSSFVYYRPIRIGGLCLSCHGTPDQLAAGVAERLAEVYPGDQATGYAVGELRGMFVVAMAWPAARAEAERLVQASRDTTGTAR